MKKQTFSAFDAADYLETEEDVAAYLEAANEEGDPKALMTAIGDVIRARNISKIARDSGLTREGLYKAFSVAGNPSFSTVVKVAKALDLDVHFRVRGSTKSTSPASRSRRVSAKTLRQPPKSGHRVSKR